MNTIKECTLCNWPYSEHREAFNMAPGPINNCAGDPSACQMCRGVCPGPHPFTQVQYPVTIPTMAESFLRLVSEDLCVSGVFALADARPWDLVIDFCGTSQDKDWVSGYKTARKFRCLAFPDGEPFPPGYLDCALGLYHRANGPVLFHCAEGVSRSASAAYAMLRVRDRLPHEAALARVVRSDGRRPHPVTLASAAAWCME